jgi:hypothetical protein
MLRESDALCPMQAVGMGAMLARRDASWDLLLTFQEVPDTRRLRVSKGKEVECNDCEWLNGTDTGLARPVYRDSQWQNGAGGC